MIERLARFRVFLGWVLGILLLYLAFPTPRSMALGIPIAIVGLTFRAAAAGTLQKNRVLAREGPYKLTRNPLYFGSFLLSLGFGIMGGRVLTLALVVVPSLVIYPTVIRNEERQLRSHFGATFEQFSQAVPCFLPRRFDSRMFEAFLTHRYLTNREYNASLGFLGATLLLLVKLVWVNQ